MKLRNLIFALFLAIGAIGFTACTGDDGAQGPQGPKGDPGEPGEPGESGESGGVGGEISLAFLKNWGKPSGKIACDDPLLDESSPAPFPGSHISDLPTEQRFNGAAAAQTGGNYEHNGYVQVTCNEAGGFFDSLDNPDLDGKPGGDLTSYIADESLVFVKDQRSTAADERAMADSGTEGEGDGRVETKTTVKLVGGRVFADLNMSGASSEALDRLRLSQDCSVGTDLPMIKGDWRGVVKTETKAQYRTSSEGATRGLAEIIPNTNIVTTTSKICVRLDSTPGSVKCYIRTDVDAPTTGTGVGIATGMVDSSTEMIATYKDMMATAVEPMAVVTTDAAADPDANALFIGSAATGETLITVNDFRSLKLCSLFKEAEHATVKIIKPQ